MIRNALSKAKCIVALWSETSAVSRWVDAEASWAWEKNKLASVLIDEGLELHVPFNTTHSHNLSGWSGDTKAPDFKKLLADLKAIAGVPPTENRQEITTSPVGDK